MKNFCIHCWKDTKVDMKYKPLPHIGVVIYLFCTECGRYESQYLFDSKGGRYNG